MSGGALTRDVLTRFLPMAATLVVGPVVAAHGTLRTAVWWILGLQVLAMSAGYVLALFPLRGRLDPVALGSLRWHLVCAAVGVLATGAFSLFPEEMRLEAILRATLGGGMIAALPMLLVAWTGPRRSDRGEDDGRAG